MHLFVYKEMWLRLKYSYLSWNEIKIIDVHFNWMFEIFMIKNINLILMSSHFFYS